MKLFLKYSNQCGHESFTILQPVQRRGRTGRRTDEILLQLLYYTLRSIVR